MARHFAYYALVLSTGDPILSALSVIRVGAAVHPCDLAHCEWMVFISGKLSLLCALLWMIVAYAAHESFLRVNLAQEAYGITRLVNESEIIILHLMRLSPP